MVPPYPRGINSKTPGWCLKMEGRTGPCTSVIKFSLRIRHSKKLTMTTAELNDNKVLLCVSFPWLWQNTRDKQLEKRGLLCSQSQRFHPWSLGPSHGLCWGRAWWPGAQGRVRLLTHEHIQVTSLPPSRPHPKWSHFLPLGPTPSDLTSSL
jgi:hypothetical protein